MGTPPLDRLGLFVAVAQAGSFSAAARRLGLPKSSVSRAVAALERELGVRLLHRTTRRVALSSAGMVLNGRVAPLLDELGRAVGDLPELEEQPSGLLRIATTVDLGARVLPDIIAQFVARYPAVEVELRLSGAVVDLVAEGIDLALRASTRPLADSSLVGRRIAPVALGIFGAPAYLARRGSPRAPRDLAGHEWVGLSRGGRLRLEGPEGAATAVPHGRVRGDDMSFVAQAVRAGIGLGVLPTFIAEPEVAAGAMVRVLPRWALRSGWVWLVTPSGRHQPRKVSAFRELAVPLLEARLARG